MPIKNPKTPGVYIDELNAFPNQVVPVATAVPAFIGYTPQAEYEGKSYLNKPFKITSLAEFRDVFGLPDPRPPADRVQQYSPQYYLVEAKERPTAGDAIAIDGKFYSILPDPYTIYYLYNSIRLFFENGGSDAYIVSVGGYGKASGKPLPDTSLQIVNPNVALDELLAGLASLNNEVEPTMYICPEATLLSVANNATLMQSMLLQADRMRTAMCIFDLIGGRDPDPILYENDIQTFRDNTGSNGLMFGVSYYPFVKTTIMQPLELDFSNLFGGDIKALGEILNAPGNPNPAVAKIIDSIENPPPRNALPNSQYQSALMIASPAYEQIMQNVFADANTLPAGGSVAGVYATIDRNEGVWNAPANVSMVGVTDVTIRLSDSQQGGLNVDAVSGKSVNAIRSFHGQGILIWGARTLDGNSLDWRYIPVRRTLTMLEQSIKLAIRAYVFEPNDANTWAAVKSTINSFLTDIWKQGGLIGATATGAFQVAIGLGTTMTPEDILNGIMRISVLVAMTRPAEFIVINFEQEMASSS